MIELSLRDNFSLLDRALMKLERDQMPYAIARALTDCAQASKAEITKEIPRIFSKGGPPKAFTINSLVAKPASKNDLEAGAMVFIKDAQAKYLALEETGGTREPAKAALVMPGSSSVDLHDPHGNLPEGFLRAIRQEVKQATTSRNRAARARAKASKLSGSSAVKIPAGNSSQEGVVYIPGASPWGGTGGYFRRENGGLKRLVGFEGEARYRPIFHYRDRVAAVCERTFAKALMSRLMEAARE